MEKGFDAQVAEGAISSQGSPSSRAGVQPWPTATNLHLKGVGSHYPEPSLSIQLLLFCKGFYCYCNKYIVVIITGISIIRNDIDIIIVMIMIMIVTISMIFICIIIITMIIIITFRWKWSRSSGNGCKGSTHDSDRNMEACLTWEIIYNVWYFWWTSIDEIERVRWWFKMIIWNRYRTKW